MKSRKARWFGYRVRVGATKRRWLLLVPGVALLAMVVLTAWNLDLESPPVLKVVATPQVTNGFNFVVAITNQTRARYHCIYTARAIYDSHYLDLKPFSSQLMHVPLLTDKGSQTLTVFYTPDETWVRRFVNKAFATVRWKPPFATKQRTLTLELIPWPDPEG